MIDVRDDRGVTDICALGHAAGKVASDPAALWRVPLPGADQAVLERVFASDRLLWRDIGAAFAGLVELGLEGAFVMAFVDELGHCGPSPPDAVVLAAATAVIRELA